MIRMLKNCSMALLVFFAGIVVMAQQPLHIADPTLFAFGGKYYLYGTGPAADKGFKVYSSTDLQQWKDEGFALTKGEAWGTAGFWAPQVFYYRKRFYMAYTANEQLSIAVSDSPLGPFRQSSLRPLSGNGRQIDPYVFFDDDGQAWLYHVRLQQGNRIFVAKMKPDLSDVDTASAREILHADLPWENTANAGWPVTEGPTVIKWKRQYWLWYSANDFRNPDYAVGVAVSKTPFGPFVKKGNGPVISRQVTGMNGSGHGDLLLIRPGRYKYVFHTHENASATGSRLGAIIDVRAVRQQFRVDPYSFRQLQQPASSF